MADVLLALGRLQEATTGTSIEHLVAELMDAMAADTTAADLRQEIEFLKAEKERGAYDTTKISVNHDALARLLQTADPGGFWSNDLGVRWVDDGSGVSRKLAPVECSAHDTTEMLFAGTSSQGAVCRRCGEFLPC